MSNLKLPKTPAQAYREVTADVAAYRVGVALRIIWEVTKPVMQWLILVVAGLIAGSVYFLWQIIFGTMKR